MIAKHIFEEGIYLLSNTGVARNPIFRNKDNYERFREKTLVYLEPLCEILAFAFHDNQWELVVKIKSRSEFEAFYKKKHQLDFIENFLIPESAFIFSQEMANLQSGFVKHFNWLNNRVGALFYRRYQKELIESEGELIIVINRLNHLMARNPHKGEWAIKKMERLKKVERRSSEEKYRIKKLSITEVICNQLCIEKYDLEAYFKNIPELKIENPFLRYLRTLNKIFAFFETTI